MWPLLDCCCDVTVHITFVYAENSSWITGELINRSMEMYCRYTAWLRGQKVINLLDFFLTQTDLVVNLLMYAFIMDERAEGREDGRRGRGGERVGGGRKMGTVERDGGEGGRGWERKGERERGREGEEGREGMGEEGRGGKGEEGTDGWRGWERKERREGRDGRGRKGGRERARRENEKEIR